MKRDNKWNGVIHLEQRDLSTGNRAFPIPNVRHTLNLIRNVFDDERRRYLEEVGNDPRQQYRKGPPKPPRPHDTKLFLIGLNCFIFHIHFLIIKRNSLSVCELGMGRGGDLSKVL